MICNTNCTVVSVASLFMVAQLKSIRDYPTNSLLQFIKCPAIWATVPNWKLGSWYTTRYRYRQKTRNPKTLTLLLDFSFNLVKIVNVFVYRHFKLTRLAPDWYSNPSNLVTHLGTEDATLICSGKRKTILFIWFLWKMVLLHHPF